MEIYCPKKEIQTMKILVPVKRVLDYNVKARPLGDGSNVDLTNAKMTLNPFCEIAIEEAVRIKELLNAESEPCDVLVVSIGVKKCQDQIRAALAMGADRGLLIETELQLEPLSTAKCLKSVIDREAPDLIILGKQSIDSENNQTGQMLAAICDFPQATFCSHINIGAESVEVTREIDGGMEKLELTLPAVVTADLRLNEPRYATLPNIMKAKKKPLTVMPLSDVDVNMRQRVHLLGVSLPPERSGGIMVGSVTELLDKLKNEAKVIA
ncbi:MAG: electron transfer flavoprotein beta subunit [Lentisphaeria bacterium]